MFRYIYFWISFIGFATLVAEDEDYFLRPQVYSKQELEQMLEERVLDMTWRFGSDGYFRFVSSNSQIGFEIGLTELPDFYDEIWGRIKPRFTRLESGRFLFSYCLSASGNEAFPESGSESFDESSYLVTDRRVIEGACPTRIGADRAAELIQGKKVLVYTGAGISLASGVYAMSELNDLLGLEEGEQFIFSLEKAIEDPFAFAKKIQTFHEACLYSSPTLAHMALKDFTLSSGAGLITENLDCLHEASGVLPYRVDAQQLREETAGKALKSFDYIWA